MRADPGWRNARAPVRCRRGSRPYDARARFEPPESPRSARSREGVVNRIGSDLKEGVRRLGRRPAFTLPAAGTLAIGLATSAAVYTYVNAYTRPLPGAAADDLYQVWFATEDSPWGAVSFPDYEDLAAPGGDELAVTAVNGGSFAASVRHGRFTDIEYGQAVAGRFFSILEIAMTVGRGFSEADDRPGADPVAVVSHEYWARQYESDPAIIGETILLNNEAYTIVGVAGPAFLGANEAYRPQFWIPYEQFLRVYRARSDTRVNREAGAVIPIVRLAEGVSEARAAAAIDGLARSLDDEAPLAERTRRFVLEPATWISPFTRQEEASTTRMMIAAAAFLLLLSCANVANLVLSDGARRHREMAVRSAVGASRRRLVRQLVTESLLLSVMAGASALAFAGPIAARLSSYFASPSVWGANVPRELVVDPRVLLFGLAAAVVTGVLTGLVPAWRASALSPVDALRAGGARGSTPSAASRPAGASRRGWLPRGRDLLVSAQIAICVVLLFVAGLVLRTLETAREVDAGFDTDLTLASYVSTSSMGVPVEERHAFFEGLILRFEELPWVEAATVAEYAPLSGHPGGELRAPGAGDPIRVTAARVWTNHFGVMGMEIRHGRGFVAADTVGATPVVLVNETLASRLAPDGDAVGRTLTWPGAGEDPERRVEVVGVVRDVRQVTLLEDPRPVVYFNLRQEYSRPGNALLVKVRDDPIGAVESMRRELRDVDTRLAIVNILPYREVVHGSLYTQRMNAELFTAIAALGLLLAAAGVFAVVARAVTGRRREIGIRMAIGAGRLSVAKAVLGPVGVSVIIGLGVGLAGAFAATRWVGSLLYGVAPADPLALAAGVGLLLLAVALAVQIPLRRAMAVDPVGSLRAE
ncbi:MAG: ADOP family duplicated permease [Gemmatimonadota bacterium]|nr:ADOP family duplicated permease [Gemmatimonadota bacterium]